MTAAIVCEVMVIASDRRLVPWYAELVHRQTLIAITGVTALIAIAFAGTQQVAHALRSTTLGAGVALVAHLLPVALLEPVYREASCSPDRQRAVYIWESSRPFTDEIEVWHGRCDTRTVTHLATAAIDPDPVDVRPLSRAIASFWLVDASWRLGPGISASDPLPEPRREPPYVRPPRSVRWDDAHHVTVDGRQFFVP